MIIYILFFYYNKNYIIKYLFFTLRQKQAFISHNLKIILQL